MKNQFIYLLTIITILCSGNLKAQSLISFKDKFGYDYIAKELLKMEESVSPLTKEEFTTMYLVLDSVINYTSLKIKPIISESNISEKDRAIKILLTIEKSLTELNFITIIGTDTFSEGLSKSKFKASDCLVWEEINDKRPNNSNVYYRLYCQGMKGANLFMTKNNLEYFKNNTSDYYYKIDCDLGALIYVSIGQINNLPINFVETDGHNFVRYNYYKKEFINWDNNSAQIFTDSEFQKGLSPSSSSTLTEQEVKKAHFLENMSTKEIIGYHYVNTARISNQNSKFKKALEQLEKAIELRPYSPLALNNLSWLYLTTEELKSNDNYQKALNLSKKVDVILPRDSNYKDTYSCACAAVGDFEQAIKLGQIAGSSPNQIDGYRRRKTCLDMSIK